jgi:hypothetical protein
VRRLLAARERFILSRVLRDDPFLDPANEKHCLEEVAEVLGRLAGRRMRLASLALRVLNVVVHRRRFGRLRSHSAI